MPVRLDELIARFGGELRGDGGVEISGLAAIEAAGPGELTFLANSKYASFLEGCRAGAVILTEASAGICKAASIVTPQPYLYFAKVAQWLAPAPRPVPGIHPTAVVETEVPASVSIGPQAWIGPGTNIGEGTVIGAHCRIGADCSLGADSRLHPGVTIYSDCRLGARALIHSGVVIGADGFGFAREADGRWVKIPQTGRVLIGDDVEIGANTTIDRGALSDTVIELGVKLDNQIQIGHNVHIGAHTAIAGCVGIAGSAKIGARCTIGGGAVILGHLQLADGVNISAGTLIAKSILKSGVYTGTVPFQDHRDWQKNFSRLRHLDGLVDRIRALEQRLAELEKLQ